jgi:hypothetical protein
MAKVGVSAMNTRLREFATLHEENSNVMDYDSYEK